MKQKTTFLEGKEKELLPEKDVKNDDKDYKQHVFIIGSKGIPAAYGGFETFVENLTANQFNDQIQYHVARMGDTFFRYSYNGAECFNVKVPGIGSARAVYYDMKALQYCIDYCKKNKNIQRPIFYVLACRIGPFISHYKKQIHRLGGLLYINPDGHEWKRSKWNTVIRKYWKISEKLMVKNADLLICDSKNIRKYIIKEYKKYKPVTRYIAYGADITKSTLCDDDKKLQSWYKEKGLSAGQYFLAVSRFVPENNFETMIREFMKSNSKRHFAIITTENNDFAKELDRKLHYSTDPRIKFVGTVYDQELLKKIRELAFAYLHGHEVGGTNPSLLEALSSTRLNLLLDVGFNKEVGRNGALYWTKEAGNLSQMIDKVEAMSNQEIQNLTDCAFNRISSAFSWEFIVNEYETLFLSRRPHENTSHK